MRAQAPRRRVPEALHGAQAPRALEGLVTVGHVVAPPVRARLEIRHAGVVIINTSSLVEEAAVDVVPGRIY